MTRVSGAMAGGVFISYRRDNAGYASKLLADRLTARYGRKQVFLDVVNIEYGDDFVEEITTAIESCRVLLAVIDPHWVAALNERISAQRKDYVRLEIELALRRGLRVIPVLVDGASAPGASELPESLSWLETTNAFQLSIEKFEYDLKHLLEALEPSLKPMAPPSEAAEDLAKVVRKQWKKETGLRGFHQDVQMLHVSWQPTAEGFESWDELITSETDRAQAIWSGSDYPLTLAGLAGTDYREICAVLDRIPTRRLVVLGQPGAGKSVLLIQLLQGLLDKRRIGDPVPVLVSLASWRPAVEDLHTWLDRRLVIDYPILRARVPGRKVSYVQALLEEHRILLLLDGLDEIPKEERPDAIRKINEALSDHEHPEGLVVACRRHEYLDAAEPADDEPDGQAEVLRAAVGIVLEPLKPRDVADYLQRGARNRKARAAWEPVTSLLGPGSTVGEVLTTPLNVTLAHAIYNNPDWKRGQDSVLKPADLLNHQTVAEMEKHLYETFITAAYRPDKGRPPTPEKGAKPPPPPPPLDKAQRWLIFLAQKEPDGLTWWGLRNTVPPWLTPLVIGLISGIAAAIAAATGAQDGIGIGVNLGAGMIAGLVCGLPFRFFSRESTSDPAGDGKPVKIEPIRGVAGGFVGGIAGGFAAGFAPSLGFGHTASTVSGLPVALGVGLAVGACTTVAGGVTGGLFGGFTAGILEGVGKGLPAAIVNGIGMALIVAVIVGIVGRDTPAARRRWSRRMGLSGGAIIGGATAIIGGVMEGPVIGLILGAAVGAIAAWPTGLLGIKVGSEEIASPVAAFYRDARAFWVTALSAGLAAAAFAFVGDGMASIFEVHKKFSVMLLVHDGLGVGLASGVVVGLVYGAYHATSPSYLIARVWLSLQRELPWKFMAFLTDAHMHRGVLRENGAVYEFRHLEIARYLAEKGKEKTQKRRPWWPAPALAYSRPRPASNPA